MLLELDDVTVRYGAAVAVDGVSLSVAAHERVAAQKQEVHVVRGLDKFCGKQPLAKIPLAIHESCQLRMQGTRREYL